MPTQKRERKKAGRQARQEAMLAARKRQSRRRTLITTVVILAILALIASATGLFSSGGSGKKVSSTASSTATSAAPPVSVSGASISGDTPCPKADGSSPKTVKFAKPPPTCIDPNKTYTATVKMTQGTMEVAFDPKQAPKTVNNFVVLARYHFYDGISCHRIVPGFVIQCGDPQGTGQGGPGYTFGDELPKAGQYKLGSLAMANSGPDTNGSQFFIITGDQGVQLPPNYSLFGQVTAGMDVAQKIDALGVANSPNGAPKEKVTIESVNVKES
jgi:cyclophilin family peptidyl-prolyl cis-trans isomerase